jgi:hypothetical protein
MTAMRGTTTAGISNEEFVAKFRDWRSLWKPTDAQMDAENSYVSKLADFIAPLPLSKLTKAVLQDFYLEEMMQPQSRESRSKVVSASISLNAFVAEFKANFPTFRAIEQKKARQG